MKIFLIVLLILPLITACVSGPSKGQLDDEVRRLCEIDGGIKVYETVKLPAHRFERDGSIYIPSKQTVKPKDGYFYESATTLLREGNPELRQYYFKVYRRADGKLLGEAVSYSRVGGDMPGPWHHSWFRCPEEADIVDLNMKVFIKK